MAKAPFRIKPYKHPRLKFVVRSKITGKWKRKFFETKAEAQTYIRLKEIELLNQGKEGATFPSSLRVMAQEADDRLRPYGRKISDAVDFYVKHLEATTRSVPLIVAMNELIENRKASGASVRYCNDLRLRISRFCSDFPERRLSEISTGDVDTWLASLQLAPVTRNTFRRDLRTLFSFGMTRRYCAENPVLQTTKAKETDGDIEILSVAETARLLESAAAETLPFWAIGAFAGLRRSEIERLDWAQVDFESGLIEVKARHSKTATRRLIVMQPNLRAWLAPYRANRGNVCPENLRVRIEADRDRAGLRENWPPNALRHSFGSFHLAHFKDAPALALQMGNTPDVIFRHYRELVKPKDAARYWQIKPSASAGRKVVAFHEAWRPKGP
ncbi:MAG TPA: tyrosine-type recombinase/integrase [Candidatus Udaeobacter sp.]|jgi:integrase